jgi:hypothetical protein
MTQVAHGWAPKPLARYEVTFSESSCPRVSKCAKNCHTNRPRSTRRAARERNVRRLGEHAAAGVIIASGGSILWTPGQRLTLDQMLAGADATMQNASGADAPRWPSQLAHLDPAPGLGLRPRPISSNAPPASRCAVGHARTQDDQLSRTARLLRTARDPRSAPQSTANQRQVLRLVAAAGGGLAQEADH